MRAPIRAALALAFTALAAGCSGRDAATDEAPAEASAAADAARAETASTADAPAVSAAPASGAPKWTVDYAASRLGFSATQSGATFDGEFKTFDAKIALDPENPEGASIDVTVDMSSASTGDKQRDSALPGSDWFKTKEFPAARYIANKVVRNADGSYVAEGELTIRGITKPLALPFSLALDGNGAMARGEVTLIRTEFGVGEGEFADASWVGLEVKVSVNIKASR